MVQNLVWTVGYNVIALPLAAGVLVPPVYCLTARYWGAADVTQHRHRNVQCSNAAPSAATQKGWTAGRVFMRE